jgi:NAD+ synthase (glutamine-hydrolysing)
MRIALAQINSRLGDFEFNKNKIFEFIQKAREQNCELVLFPEASLFGYHPVDLLERPSIVRQQESVLREIHREIPKNLAVIVGAIVPNKDSGKAFFNAAVLLQKGQKMRVFAKQLLPTYDVFDESRHIQPGDTAKNFFSLGGRKILMTVCEDIWAWPLKSNPKYSRYKENPIKKIKASQVDLVLNMSASPFTHSKFKNRGLVTAATAKHLRAPLIYVNMVGAQDELIFDGGSFAVDSTGRRIAQCARFEEDFNVVDLPDTKKRNVAKAAMRKLEGNAIENSRHALVLGIRDFVTKTGFKKVHLGLSGGIDSAVVACLATEALGPENVTAFALPGPFSAAESTAWAKQQAKNLGIGFLEIPISGAYEKLLQDFESSTGKENFGLVNENLQARIRGIYLMAYSNRSSSLLLGTSNKSELAVGYSTLYGDLCGGLQPIGDLLKTEIYQLAKAINKDHELIPKGVVTRAPSAELRAGQKDQDSLPPYETLDPIVRRLVEGQTAPRGPLEKKILAMMMRSEFKRWQAPPILKVSDHAFGRGRRFPVASSAKE